MRFKISYQQEKLRFSHLSTSRFPIKTLFIAYFGAVLTVVLILWASFKLYSPPAMPGINFFKDYVPVYLATITLVIGLPVTFASSLAVLLLAKASVEATMEQPRMERERSTINAVKEIFNGWLDVVSALNAVDDEIAKVNDCINGFDRDPIAESEGDMDWFSIERLLEPLEDLGKSVSIAIRRAEHAFRQPIISSYVIFFLRNYTPLIEVEFPEIKGQDGFATLVAFVGLAARHKPNIKFPSRTERLRDLYIKTEDCDRHKEGVAIKARLDPAAEIAVAGLSFWERSEIRCDESYKVKTDDKQELVMLTWKTEMSERLLAAAFICDLVTIIPDEEGIINFMNDHNQNVRTEVDPAVLKSSAAIYNARRGLRAGIIDACKAFRLEHDNYKRPVGSLHWDAFYRS